MDLLAKARILVLNSAKFCLKLIHWRLLIVSDVYVLFVPKRQISFETPYLRKV